MSLGINTPWLEMGYGASHLDDNPCENTLTTVNVGSIGALWSSPTNSYGGTPTIAGGRVFVGTAAGIEALPTATLPSCSPI